jgi:hypothetical protein
MTKNKATLFLMAHDRAAFHFKMEQALRSESAVKSATRASEDFLRVSFNLGVIVSGPYTIAYGG